MGLCGLTDDEIASGYYYDSSGNLCNKYDIFEEDIAEQELIDKLYGDANE